MADDTIHLLIEACSARTAAETSGLTVRLLDECWPGGADHTQPGAREWVRRWHAGRSEAALPACTCSTGRCSICN